MKKLILPLFSLALLSVSPSVSAVTVFFNVSLDGVQSGINTPATGTAVATFDTVTGAMSITGTFSGLLGTSTNAHLHGFTAAAATGGSAGVLIPLAFDFGVNSGSFSGSGVISSVADPGFANTLGGQTYINIHSGNNPAGEIRGALINPVPEPSAALLGGLAALSALGIRRRK